MDHKLFSQQVKTLSTVDVRFDKRSDMVILNQECIDKYQENAYLLGRIFQVEQPEIAAVEVEEKKDGAVATMEIKQENKGEEEEEDDDYELGELMNEIAAQSFAEKDTVADDEAMTGGDGDEEVAELKAYLTELQADFRAQKAEQDRQVNKVSDERTAFLDFIQKVKLQGVGNEKETGAKALQLLGSQKGCHPLLKHMTGEAATEAEMSSFMPWDKENRDKLKVLSM